MKLAKGCLIAVTAFFFLVYIAYRFLIAQGVAISGSL